MKLYLISISKKDRNSIQSTDFYSFESSHVILQNNQKFNSKFPPMF